MNRLQKHLASRKFSERMGPAIAGFCVVLLVLLCLLGAYAMYEDGDRGGMTFMVVLAIGVSAALIWAECRSMKRSRQRAAHRAAHIAGLSDTDFERLEDEISLAEKRFKTFYLLQDYLYVPKERLLLPYDKIQMWKTVRHSTNGLPDSAWVDISEPDGCQYKVNVVQWKKYLQHLDDFIEELDDRRRNAAALHTGEKVDNDTLC